MKIIKFGFSIGSFIGTEQYTGTVEGLIKKGIKDFRVFDPFNKGFDTNPDKIVAAVEKLTRYKTGNVIICLRGIPYSWLPQYDLSGLTPKQLEASTYSNRFAPKSASAYTYTLNTLIDKLEARGLQNNIKWEIGGESDAEKFFWGTYQEFVDFNQLKYDIIRSRTDSQIWGGSFTSSLLRDKTYKNKQQYHDYVQTTSLFDQENVAYSNSFYWTDSGGTFNPQDNDWPTRVFNDIVISEYNMYVNYTKGSIKDQTQNSPEFVTKLCDFLKFVYDKPVSQIMMFPLCELVHLGTGKMGFMERLTDQYHTIYYLPKPCYNYFMTVYDVVRTGYIVSGSNIIGTTKSIIFNGSGWTVVNN